MNDLVTEIDKRNRPGCLTGIVRTGEKYAVSRVSPVEVRFVLLEPATLPKPKIGKSHGRTVLTGGRRLTRADVDKELENFP
jgi:hypothetical protein